MTITLWKRLTAALFRSLRLQTGVFPVGERLQRRQHLAGEQADVLVGELARQRRELQHAEKILEPEQAVALHQLLAPPIGATAYINPHLDNRVPALLLTRLPVL